MLYENSWQLWHFGRMFAFSLKKKGGAIARNGAFHYLYRVLPIGRAIAMACVNLRGGALASLRWCVSVIAMV